MREAVIVDCLRTPVGKAPRGALRNTRPDDLGALPLRALLEKYPAAKDLVEDVIIGCAMPEGEAGANMARQAALRAGLPDSVPAMTINRFCSSGLQAIALAAERIRAGSANVILAGGAESMSMTPFGGRKPAPNPWFVEHWPEVYMSMGLTAERMQRKYGVNREDADAFALRSHQNAVRALNEGRFAEETVPVPLVTASRIRVRRVSSSAEGSGAGLAASPVDVNVPGGHVIVEWDGAHEAFLSGPAVRVFDAAVDDVHAAPL